MAAKYPDRFACVVAGQGISDLVDWSRSAPPRAARSCQGGMSRPLGPDPVRLRAPLRDPLRPELPLRPAHRLARLQRRSRPVRAVGAARRGHPQILSPAGGRPLAAGRRAHGGRFPRPLGMRPVGVLRQHLRRQHEGPHPVLPGAFTGCGRAARDFLADHRAGGRGDVAKVSAAIKDNTLTIKTARTRRVAVQIEKIVAGLSFSCVVATSDGPTALAICRGDKQLFGMTCEKKKSADVPAEIWTQPNLAGN